MTQIKSERAKEYIREHILGKKFNDGLDHSCVRAEAAVLAIHFAEQEAEERHTKELQEVHDMYKQIFIERYQECESDKYHTDNNHEITLRELKYKAVVAHKQSCHYLNEKCNCTCSSIQAAKCPTQNFMCNYMISFINELNK